MRENTWLTDKSLLGRRPTLMDADLGEKIIFSMIRGKKPGFSGKTWFLTSQSLVY